MDWNFADMQAQSRHSTKPFLQSSDLGGRPPPHTQANVPPPPLFPGGGHTRLRERGVGRSQFGLGDNADPDLNPPDFIPICKNVLETYS
jgi:hypothetical protein